MSHSLLQIHCLGVKPQRLVKTEVENPQAEQGEAAETSGLCLTRLSCDVMDAEVESKSEVEVEILQAESLTWRLSDDLEDRDKVGVCQEDSDGVGCCPGQGAAIVSVNLPEQQMEDSRRRPPLIFATRTTTRVPS